MKSDRWNVYLLAIFTACLVCTAGIVTYMQLRPADDDNALDELLIGQISPEDQPPISAPGLEAPDEGIVSRDLFAPVIREPKVTEANQEGVRGQTATMEPLDNSWIPPMVGGFPAVPGGVTGWTSPQPAPQIPTYGPSAPATLPPPVPMAASSPAPPERTRAVEPRIAVTGVTSSGGSTRVLVEDVNTGKRSWVAPGDSAYGFRVDYATGRGAVVSREGKSQVLRVGENKPTGAAETKPAGSSQPASPAAPAKPPGGNGMETGA
jgi:hypothetical protein